ncbi:hypothetical protein OK074_0445 [Actinobacteria bacterium OK074]|nr:hypothetical protein OK074_0445 [Actinobacteria bacterium OK074]
MPRIPGRRPNGAAPRPPDAALWPTLAVLTPLVAAVSAVLLLLIGHGLRLAGTDAGLGGSVVTAGRVLAFAAVLSGAVGIGALMGTAVRRRPAGPESGRRAEGRDAA